MRVYNINTETEAGLSRYNSLLQVDSWLFKILEKKFDAFMDANGDRNELNEKYFSDEAIFTKKGAIQGAIEMVFEVMDEEEPPLPFIELNDSRLDFESSWND